MVNIYSFVRIKVDLGFCVHVFVLFRMFYHVIRGLLDMFTGKGIGWAYKKCYTLYLYVTTQVK